MKVMRIPDGKRLSNARLKPKGDVFGERPKPLPLVGPFVSAAARSSNGTRLALHGLSSADHHDSPPSHALCTFCHDWQHVTVPRYFSTQLPVAAHVIKFCRLCKAPWGRRLH